MESFDCVVPDVNPSDGKAIVYCYTLEDGKQYIGQTRNGLQMRHYMHIHSNGKAMTPFDEKIRGCKFHIWVIGEYSIQNVYQKENDFIKIFDTISPRGYNTTLTKQKAYNCGRKKMRGLSTKIKTIDDINLVLDELKYDNVSNYRDSLFAEFVLLYGTNPKDTSRCLWSDYIPGTKSYLVCADKKISISLELSKKFERFKNISPFNRSNEPIFPCLSHNNYGKFMEQRSLSRISRELMKKAGIYNNDKKENGFVYLDTGVCQKIKYDDVVHIKTIKTKPLVEKICTLDRWVS